MVEEGEGRAALLDARGQQGPHPLTPAAAALATRALRNLPQIRERLAKKI